MKMTKNKLFKILILAELAISIVSSFSHRHLYHRLNESLISTFEKYRNVSYDTRNLIDSPAVLIVSIIMVVYIYYGMLTYKKHARWLYILAFPISNIVITYLSGTMLAHPLTVVLRNAEYLLFGAIIVLSFSEPICTQFENNHTQPDGCSRETG